MRGRSSAAVLLLCLLTACGQDPGSAGAEKASTTSAPTPTASDRPTAPVSTSPSVQPGEPGTKLIRASSEFGTILFGATGQAVYIFDVETTTEPRCYAACAEAWPPVLTDGAPVAGQGLRQSLLGTASRRDGTTQVTYGGHPLYFYAHEGRHEVKCHDVFLNGGNWYAVQPDGRRAP